MLIYWFLPMTLFLGIVTSYEDIKFGKIRNKWIVLGLIYLIVTYFFLYFFYAAYNLNLMYLTYLLINGIFALITGFLIWFLGLWTAGDAKLFFVYSMLLPLDLYQYNSNVFPSINILINTLVPAALFLTIFAIIKILKSHKSIVLVKSFRLQNILILVLFIFAIPWPLNSFLSLIGIRNNYLSLLLAFLLYLVFEKAFRMSAVLILVLLSIFRIIFDKKIYLLQTWANLLAILLIFIFIRFFLLNLSYFTFSKNVNIKDLKTGMIPAEIIYERNGKFRKVRIVSPIIQSSFDRRRRKYLYNYRPEGLNRKDIVRIRNARLPFSHVRVHQTVGFALFMFIGVLLTLIFSGNMFISLKNFY